MRPLFLFCVLTLLTVLAPAQTPYKFPPPEVVDILDATPTPLVSVSPARDALAYIEYRANPPIELLARPFLRIAGLRITPGISARQRITQYTGITVQQLDTKRETRIALPANARISIPSWSHDGKKLAFTRDVENGVEL
jgi:dipeptidyl aminopeptidase/acylaminoacyl peptidase